MEQPTRAAPTTVGSQARPGASDPTGANEHSDIDTRGGGGTVIRSLWASIQGDPVFMRRVNGWLTIFWLIMIPVSLVTHWVTSVVYVSALSLWALVSGHWSAWQAARVEVAQQEEAKRREQEDIPRDVVDELVRKTTIQADPP